jgi:hypothetical protein
MVLVRLDGITIPLRHWTEQVPQPLEAAWRNAAVSALTFVPPVILMVSYETDSPSRVGSSRATNHDPGSTSTTTTSERLPI